MNNGDDTAYYLRQGFRVVAVEANPALAEAAGRRFADDIAAGRLTVLNRAVWDALGPVTFHVNADNDHWSSVDQSWAAREDSRLRAVQVETIGLRDLVETFGVPHYIKVDIEGADLVALRQLTQLARRPDYVSVEDCRFGFDYISTLRKAGYTAFKLSDQSVVPSLRDETTGAHFPVGASGPYADALPGPWRSYDAFVDHYARTVRDRAGQRMAPRTQWWDIHAALSERGAS